MRSRRFLPAPTELHLTGLLTEPDPAAAERMKVFDELPEPVRQFLDECPFDFNAGKAARCVRDHGVRGTLSIMRGSVVGETRRWVRDRDAALAWARDAFRVGPRPKNEPPPEGWTVHNFTG